MTEYELVKKRVNELLEARKAAACSGTAKDYAEYRALCGEIQGLSLALSEVQDLANREQELDDD